MNREMKIIREVNIQAENFYDEAVKLGDHAAYALKAIHRSQITALESLAESAFKTSDVFDFIKKQIARFSYWRQPFPEHKETNAGFGERLKSYLEQGLTGNLDTICEHLGNKNKSNEEKQERRHIHLLLMRQFIRQMAAEYEYQVGTGTKKKE